MASSKPPVIFVVNSSEETVDALRNCFEDEGYNTASMHVDEIRKGSQDVVTFVAKHAFDVAVWDVAPPYDHNWNFLKLVRKAFPELPFVITTTNKKALEDFVGKKTEAIELLGKVLEVAPQLGERDGDQGQKRGRRPFRIAAGARGQAGHGVPSYDPCPHCLPFPIESATTTHPHEKTTPGESYISHAEVRNRKRPTNAILVSV